MGDGTTENTENTEFILIVSVFFAPSAVNKRM
jgi:hypothetical protein